MAAFSGEKNVNFSVGGAFPAPRLSESRPPPEKIGAPLPPFETPLVEIGGIFLKLENVNIGGSHKSRSARWIIARAIEDGDLQPGGGQTILEKTGENLGIGLVIEAAKHGIPVELAVGMNFSARKKSLLKRYGAILIGAGMMQKGALPREVVAFHLENQKNMGKSYVFLDQFNNSANLEAHLRETGPEIVRQIKSLRPGTKEVFLVGGVGSGASVSGAGMAVKEAFPDAKVIAVQPEGCDILREVFVEHELQGIAVGVNPKTLQPEIIDRWELCGESEAMDAREWLLKNGGIYAGPSTGANIKIARQIARERPGAIVVTFVYDSGDTYE